MSKIIIASDKCKGCELCIEACPKKCIEISSTLNKKGHKFAIYIDKGTCSACGLCYQTCPDYCIEVHKTSS